MSFARFNRSHRLSMRIASLQSLLTAADEKHLSGRTIFWLALSLAVAAAFAAQGLQQAFRAPYVVQDDARQHVFWMSRFLDPELFPRDLIADYFQSVAPLGYTALYRAIISLGLDPFVVNKILPVALGLVMTGFCFGVCMRLLPVPFAAFASTLLLNGSLWMEDDLVSATPRAFLYPLFLAFVYFLLRRKLVPCLIALALEGLFYPSFVFISAGVLLLSLVRIENRRLAWSRDRLDYIFCAAGLGVAAAVMLAFAFKTSGYGPVIWASEAKGSAEFWPGGRSSFFGDGGLKFWLRGRRSGLLPESLFTIMPIYAGFVLPFLVRHKGTFPLAGKVASGSSILLRIALASLAMFLAAHVLLFKLHLPSRYTQHSLRMLLSLAAGISLVIMLDAIFRWAAQKEKRAQGKRLALAWAAALGLAVALLWQPLNSSRTLDTKYRVGGSPSLYEFFAAQPKDTLIASLAHEADYLPSLARRSTLVGREYAIPYHTGYYGQIRNRAHDLIEAQYARELGVTKSFIQKYGIDFLIIDRRAFTPNYLANNRWAMQYKPASTDALSELGEGVAPALSKLVESCSVFNNDNLVVLSADCILKAGEQ